jgi:hypothetical protein
MIFSDEDLLVMDALGIIRRELGYSYPYSAGSVTINYDNYPKKILERILKYFRDREASIVIYPNKRQIVIKDYMGYC